VAELGPLTFEETSSSGLVEKEIADPTWVPGEHPHSDTSGSRPLRPRDDPAVASSF